MSPSSCPPCTLRQSLFPTNPPRAVGPQVCQLFPDLVSQLQRVSLERIGATTQIATSRENSGKDAGAIAAKVAEWEQV